MSDAQQPRPYGQQAGSKQAPTEWIGSQQPPGQGTGPDAGNDGDGGGGRRRLLVVGAAAAALVLIVGGGVLAFQVLSGGGPQPADAIPDDAIAYARIDLDPSAEQKVNAVRLLRSVPEFEEETGITSETDDLRRRLFEEALADSEGCSEVDYDNDIAPWIGDRAGAAAMPGTDGAEPKPLLVLQVTDEGAARDGIEALLECSEEEDEPAGLAFVGDYALLAETQGEADDYAAAAEESPLSEDEAFGADMEALDGEGIASFWVDLDAVLGYLEQSDPETAQMLEAAGYDDVGSISAAIRAQSDALEFVAATTGEAFAVGSSEPAGDVQALPESTLMALGFTGGGDAVDKFWEQLLELEGSGVVGEFGSIEEFAAQIEAQTGLVIPDDIGTLLGEEFTLAVDSGGFEIVPETGAPDLSTINVGARLRTDAEAAADLVSRVQALLAQSGIPFELAQQEVDGGLVIAANEGYADALASGGDLGDADVFDSAVADSDDAVAVLFLDLDKLDELVDRVAGELGEDVPPEVSDTLDVLSAFGVSSVVDGDYNRTTVRLVFG